MDELFTLFATRFLEDKWIFHGHSNVDWTLEPSIERVASRPQIIEEQALREFRRRAHHYYRGVPAAKDHLEWLALMQHHGAPTRLLDWTASPYVAAYFAVEQKAEGTSAAVWAIDREAVEYHSSSILAGGGDPISPDSFPELLNTIIERQYNERHCVVAVRPSRLNERLSVQQGWFMCGTHPLLGFRRSLGYLLNRVVEPVLHKVEFDNDLRFNLLKTLHRMNINRASLFPGLDGFSASLRTWAEIQEGEERFVAVPLGSS